MEIAVFWFRRDLRLHDNTALNSALTSGKKVLALFIFDTIILNELEKDDARVNFIHETLSEINLELKNYGSSILVKKGNPLEVWQELLTQFNIKEVYANKDYEPYGISRDQQIHKVLSQNNCSFTICKDHVIFEENEVIKNDGLPYTVYTPYKNKWLEKFHSQTLKIQSLVNTNFYEQNNAFPKLEEIGFKYNNIKVKPINLNQLEEYHLNRDFPAKDSGTNLGPHLRFGTVSVRQMVKIGVERNQTFLHELIWREFFMQILFHFPQVVTQSFKKQYDNIEWRNNTSEFEQWCKGETGYPMIDAGMKELNATGYMHNRVRMVVASFLCKHLLIDWRWGEAYFAKKLLDYELASNNGNWQWAAGTGCDAAPYFRVFNPSTQEQKFDPEFNYIKKWLPNYQEISFTLPIVEHKFARDRAISTYKNGLK
ncbi:MAG TPA: deoxyribodipyrimidine photo-lyase [Vicingus sp.]|nr:deoxyribodipyrimidine photo-lyase [Vicingus sp.]